MQGLALIFLAVLVSAAVGSQTATLLALIAALSGGIPLDSPLLFPFVVVVAFVAKVVSWVKSTL